MLSSKITVWYTILTNAWKTFVAAMYWFKESTDRWKTSFLKETVENADLHKAVLNKTMTTQE